MSYIFTDIDISGKTSIVIEQRLRKEGKREREIKREKEGERERNEEWVKRIREKQKETEREIA